MDYYGTSYGSPPSSGGGWKKYVIVVAILSLVIIAVIGYYAPRPLSEGYMYALGGGAALAGIGLYLMWSPSSSSYSAASSSSPGGGWKKYLLMVAVLATLAAMGYYVYLLITTGEVAHIDLTVVPEGVNKLFGSSKSQLPETPSVLQEVYYVSGNNYTYDDAPAVCAVYNGELATYDQIAEAFAKGAEWCGYGWTMGGMALYPTQEKSWARRIQEVDTDKRTKCGRPGINGGYFDPATKFGVNCYGVKPNCNNKKYPTPDGLGLDAEKVNKFKQDSSRIKVDPFSRLAWSMWGTLA
jgi:hypothetical protein